ncbi:MAG: DUF5662 family protein [Eubacteriales bacterium]|nr:DUF5662 family protein [Eubacteriales bacterium]
MKALGHFRTINHHKLLVMKGCFKVGLYRQGIMHDMSKYMPSEFLVGCKYFQGTRSPNNAEREATGVSSAWLHHKGRNKHHYEYWIDYSLNRDEGFVGVKMPEKYIVEMFIDRISASKTYNKEYYNEKLPLMYYERGAEKLGNMLHKDTADLLKKLLIMLSEKGEEETCRYIRREILKNDSNLSVIIGKKIRNWYHKARNEKNSAH